MHMANEPKFAVGDKFTKGAACWKVTAVYGQLPTYRGNLYAAVRWIKTTQKWSANSYLHTEPDMVAA
jgi:hypothetical protein